MGLRQTPNAARKSNKTVRFRDSLVDAEELDNHQVLQLHNRVMEEQDESLDRLSESIRTQRELSIQIGDELDTHVQLLDEVDGMVDRHQGRLNQAKRKLDHVAKTAKDHGMLYVPRIGNTYCYLRLFQEAWSSSLFLSLSSSSLLPSSSNLCSSFIMFFWRFELISVMVYGVLGFSGSEKSYYASFLRQWLSRNTADEDTSQDIC